MKNPATIVSIILSGSLLCACNLPQNGTNSTAASTPAGTPTTQAQVVLTGLTPNSGPGFLSTAVLPSPTQTLFTTLTLVPPTLTMPPSLTPTKYLTETPSITPIPDPGSIAGSISGYPYGAIPALAVVASKQDSPHLGSYSYIITAPGSTYYSMSTSYLIPGQWLVVAYDASGNSGGCSGLVTVISNQTVTCNIGDWVSAYPSKPSGVPNP